MRLVGFLIWLAALIVLFGVRWWAGLAFFALTLPLLAWAVRRHRAIGRAAARARTLAELAGGELAALNHEFGAFADGAEFLHVLHRYALDLDVFGPGSLFQFINRTVTAPGRVRLAAALLGDHDEEQRARTQVQSKLLSKDPDWCLSFRAIGDGLADDVSYFDRLLDWVEAGDVAPVDRERWLLYAAPLLSVAGVAWMLLASPWQLGVLFFLPAVWMLRRYRTVVEEAHERTAAMGELLRTYAELLDFATTRPGGVTHVGDPAAALRRLAYLTGQLDVRYNPFAIFLEVGGLWSLNRLRQLDAWRARYRRELPAWLDLLAETDALVSWATLRFNRPGWADPAFNDEQIVEARNLGHPLLHPAGRVTNDFAMRTDGHIHLVTGSNMAGKSTWLRTVGLNIVLANAGGPVCAISEDGLTPALLNLPPDLEVWTSMRTQDDLTAATSSFYAELKRLSHIVRAVSDPDRRVFFLLDEILKGTNSRDRHTGSRALIRQLIRDRGAGIIATHDLELAALQNEPGSRVENFAMEVQTRGEQLYFDYKLRPGVCESFNATALMARMGIEIPPEEIRLRHD